MSEDLSTRLSALRPIRRSSGSGTAAILLAAVLWGSTGTAASFAPAGVPAGAVGAAGLLFGGLLLWLSSRGNRLPHNRFDWGFFGVGAIAVAVYPVTFYPAVARTGVAVATVTALGSAPVFAGLTSWIIGRGRPSGRWLLATVLAVIGCAVLVLGPELTGAGAPIDPIGIALAACAGFTYTVYSLAGAKLIARGHPSNAVMGTMFGVAAVLVAPVVLHAGIDWLATPRGALVTLHLAVFTCFLAYRLFGYGLRHTGVETATTLTLAEPAVAAVLGVTVVGERLPLPSWCGMAVLAVGLAVLTLPSPVRAAPAWNAFASRRNTRSGRRPAR
ncbi:DMT family transporter [Nocardia sp. NPDC056100]|uniref:DMT family transporter n=1 Tax=Nocardia sp. NPDC056100 TaxID=3345712 RepID=UPI0035E19526